MLDKMDKSYTIFVVDNKQIILAINRYILHLYNKKQKGGD